MQILGLFLIGREQSRDLRLLICISRDLSMEAAMFFCGDTLTRGRYGSRSKITDLCTDTIASYLTLLRLYGQQGALRVKVYGGCHLLLRRYDHQLGLVTLRFACLDQMSKVTDLCTNTIAS